MAKTAILKGKPAKKSTTKPKKPSVVSRAKSYKKELDRAYDAGYKSGWTDASKIKNSSAGARSAAKTGYGKALDNQNRIRKYTERSKK